MWRRRRLQIIKGEIYVEDSQYYASMEEYLISNSEFTSKRNYYLKKLKLPMTGEEFVKQLTDELNKLFDEMNRNYETLKKYTKISRGSLSFSRQKKEELDAEIKKLDNLIKSRMKPVSIIDIMVDIDKLTGFLDYFKTIGYKEGISRQEKARRMIATLLCYGCNLGPTQTERSTGVSAASILYMRRRYCSEESLLSAIGFLSDCQHQTWLADAYGDGTGFITDGTMYSAPKKSMHTAVLFTSRAKRRVPHFRYGKGHGVICYPLRKRPICCVNYSGFPHAVSMKQ